VLTNLAQSAGEELLYPELLFFGPKVGTEIADWQSLVLMRDRENRAYVRECLGFL
jgi:hypothetical protein